MRLALHGTQFEELGAQPGKTLRQTQGAVQSETHDEEGSSLLAVRIPRVELNRLVTREGLQPLEFIEQHTLQ